MVFEYCIVLFQTSAMPDQEMWCAFPFHPLASCFSSLPAKGSMQQASTKWEMTDHALFVPVAPFFAGRSS
jgi:hypothetical protein